MFKSKFITIILCLFITIIAYIIIDHFRIKRYSKLGLTNYSTASCYITFKVENRGKIYQVVSNNERARRWIIGGKNKILASTLFYPVYMDKVIRYDLNVRVDDHQLSDLEPVIVDNVLWREVEGKDIRNDRSILTDYDELRMDLKKGMLNACTYELLRQGYTLCVDSFSGKISVSGSRIQ